MRFGIIYLLRCKKSRKSYVGQTTQSARRRFLAHLYASERGSQLPLHRALRKHGRRVFTVSILEECSSLEELNSAETRWIAELGTFGAGGYNCTTGGEGFTMSEETRARISRARAGTCSSDATKRRLSRLNRGKGNPFYGRHHTPESIEAARKKISEKLSGEKNPFYGKRHPKEIQDRITQKNLGKTMHPNTRAGIAAANLGNSYTKGHVLTTEHKEKFSKLSAKDVIFIKKNPQMTQKVLGEMLGVGPWTIANVQKGHTWKEITI